MIHLLNFSMEIKEENLIENKFYKCNFIFITKIKKLAVCEANIKKLLLRLFSHDFFVIRRVEIQVVFLRQIFRFTWFLRESVLKAY
jgi:hypothetical protein